MNKHIQRLFLFEKYEIRTKIPKREILRKVRDFADSDPDYYGSISENGFFIAEHYIRSIPGGRVHNSFAPIAKATVTEEDGTRIVSIVFRMHILVIILFAPFYFLSLLTLVTFPFMWLLMYIAFIRPVKRFKNHLTDLLTNDTIYEER